jgi:acetoin:2,6-dichlorophenolindophenol oxidoreductase subunit alpha
VDEELALEGFRRMCRVRAFEEATLDLVRKGQGVAGAVHLCIGHEATIVGSCLALRDDDYIVGYHRSHGHPVAKGASLGPLMAELMGRATGVCHGKGGSMHLADFKVGSLGETAIVGSGIPQAAGAAYSARIRGSDQVALSFFGDGASNIGTFHEGLNLAAVWNLGVVFVCENNLYAMSTSLKDTSAVASVATRALAYDLPGVGVDGQDLVAVYEAVGEAVARARSGGGPTLVEARTYRFRDHTEYGNVDLSHRDPEEVEQWLARDPIKLHRTRLLSQYGIMSDVLEGIEEAAAVDVKDAVAFAKSSPVPEPEELFEDLWATPLEGAR